MKLERIANKVLHLTATPLRTMAAGELDRYAATPRMRTLHIGANHE